MTSPTPLLDKITNPADLRKLPSEDLHQLADELRHETISAVEVVDCVPACVPACTWCTTRVAVEGWSIPIRSEGNAPY